MKTLPPFLKSFEQMSNVELTAALKHLLSLRNPKALPSPPLYRLQNVFTKTFRNAQAKKAETGWLVTAVSFFDLVEFELTSRRAKGVWNGLTELIFRPALY